MTLAVETQLGARQDRPSNIASLMRAGREDVPWKVDIPAYEGMDTSIERVREAIDAKPEATTLVVSHIDQRTFELTIDRFGGQFTAINLWKCPKIADLTPLEAIESLEYLAAYWNQRSIRFWDFARNPRLRGLSLEDFTKVHTLDDLARATSIEELRFGNAIWRSWVFESLEPVAALGQLKSFSFDAKKIGDGRIQPLAALQRLRSLAYPANQFTTPQVAWLRARLPESVMSRCLEPFWGFREPNGPAHDHDTRIVGMHKPWLNSERDAARIQHYVNDFWRMVNAFRANPELQPD